jgi:uroporphyrinogen-III synthase
MPDTGLPPVVVTRPLAQAAPLADAIAARGRRAEIFPLLDILPLDDDAPLRAELARLADYALVAFVSPNAIAAAFAQLDAWPAGPAIAVMGQGSRESLQPYAIPAQTAIYVPTHPQQTDSTTLLAELDLPALRGRRALIVRGTDGREFLADALREAGVDVAQVAAYRRAAPAFTPALGARLAQLVDAGADWIVTSSQALRIALELADNAGGPALVAKLQRQHLLLPHARIAESARELGFTHLTRTASGDSALLAALQY